MKRNVFRWIGLAVAVGAVLLPLLRAPLSPEGPAAYGASFGAPQQIGQDQALVMVLGDRPSIDSALTRLGGGVDYALADGTIAAHLPVSRVAELEQARGIAHVIPDGGVASATLLDNPDLPPQVWQKVVRAPQAWAKGVDGQGVTVAVIDSGLDPKAGDGFDRNGLLAQGADPVGHGTHVGGIVAGDKINPGPGLLSGLLNWIWNQDSGMTGVAPGARVINVPVAAPRASALVNAIDWAVANRQKYNIRVLNISAGLTSNGSYLTSMVDAAVERAWFSGIVVVVAAGNDGPGTVSHAPANDPFVITVGAIDDRGTAATNDDVIPSWSASGKTLDHVAKPDVVAPGRHIVSLLANGHPSMATSDHVVAGSYLNLTGTSMSSPVVAGIAAMVLEMNPGLSPDEVKARIVKNSTAVPGSPAPRADAYNAIFGPAAGKANQHQPINLLLASAAHLIDLHSIDWSSISWDSISWDAVKWTSISWDSISWDCGNWNSISWDSISWDSISWDALSYKSISWDSITWDGLKWASATGD